MARRFSGAFCYVTWLVNLIYGRFYNQQSTAINARSKKDPDHAQTDDKFGTEVICAERRLGIKTRNPFLNFLRDYRMRTNLKHMPDICKAGGAEWRRLSDVEKMPYIMMALRQPQKRRKLYALRRAKYRGMSEVKVKKETIDDEWRQVTYLN